jgi:hypothetical protein
MTECVVLPFPKRPRPTVIADAADAEIARKWLIVRLFLQQHADFDPVEAARATEQNRWPDDGDWMPDVFAKFIPADPDLAAARWPAFAAQYAETDAETLEAEIEWDELDYERLYPDWTGRPDF